MPDDPRATSRRAAPIDASNLGALHSEWMRQWEESVSKWWDSALEDPAFSTSMSEALAGRACARSLQSQITSQALDQMHLPSRQDVLRVAKIASLLEDRLVALEDRLEETVARLDRMEKENLRARIEMTELLLRIEERLAQGEPGAEPAKRKRKG